MKNQPIIDAAAKVLTRAPDRASGERVWHDDTGHNAMVVALTGRVRLREDIVSLLGLTGWQRRETVMQCKDNLGYLVWYAK